MPFMYFSGEKEEDITFDDPADRCIKINPELYANVRFDNQQNARVFLDTPLLKIRGLTPKHDLPIDRIGPIVSKGGASVSLETRVFMSALVYVTNSITTAECREMTCDQFKSTYLAPLDDALTVSNIIHKYLLEEYVYPVGNAAHVEGDIQDYFDRQISYTIEILYQEICGISHKFGRSSSILRPPLNRSSIIKPDIVHIYTAESALNFHSPDVCFAIGDYKKENYYLILGF